MSEDKVTRMRTRTQALQKEGAEKEDDDRSEGVVEYGKIEDDNKASQCAKDKEDEDEVIRRKRRRKEQFLELRDEMELVEHGKGVSGQSRRKISREQSVRRTKKRKQLEKTDNWTKIEGGDATNKVRGSMVAIEDEIVKGSLVFGNRQAILSSRNELPNDKEEDGDNDDDDDDDDQDDNSNEEVGKDDNESSDEEVDTDEELEDEENEDEENENEEKEAESTNLTPNSKQAGTNEKSPSSANLASTGRSTASSSRPRRRRLQRLRNFRSSKMAEKHGDALGAHAQGKPTVAIRKLKQVALKAPTAPQIYSSLGMVYEDMLIESQRKGTTAKVARKDTETDRELTPTNRKTVVRFANDESMNKNSNFDGENGDRVGANFQIEGSNRGLDQQQREAEQDKHLSTQLRLAKKAYGSYHVAAILCKRDYNLWLRAGDSAAEIATLHTKIMLLPGAQDPIIEYNRSEKQRWLEEAKNDYQTADNLDPPGIDIQAKLAHTFIQLGMLADALTLLTNLKNHTEFQISYRAWLLYSDLMLRIGHECSQWNKGIQTNSNYMFRRWLRKLSSTFDWRERRLQGLVKALEAACGSKSCQNLIQWMKRRADSIILADENGNETEPFTADAGYEDDKKLPVNFLEKERLDSRNSFEKDSIGNSSSPSVPEQRFKNNAEKEAFEKEKEILMQHNKEQLDLFDKTTNEICRDRNTEAVKERTAARSALLQSHKAALIELVGEYHMHKKLEPSSAVQPSDPQGSQNEEEELPMSASCRSVFSIASELVRHALDMKLYDGGRMVGEAVSNYLKERIAKRDRRKYEGQKYSRAQNEPVQIFAMAHEAYDLDNQMSEDDEDSNEIPLSDDDDLDSSEDKTYIEILRKGFLPPELRFLHGLCLAGEGGKAFLAAKCIEAATELPQEDTEWLREKVVDTNVSTDSVWQMFEQAMTEPMLRTSALAFAADTLAKSGRESDFFHLLSPLYNRHTSELIAAGMSDVVFKVRNRYNPLSRNRQNYLAKVFVAGTRYDVGKIEKLLLAEKQEHRQLLLDAVDSIAKLFPVIWNVENDGSISSTVSEAVRALAKTLRLCSLQIKDLEGESIADFAKELVSKSLTVISILCNGSTFSVKENYDTVDFNKTPMQCSWLTTDMSKISVRAFNLCVATNVSLFSGWESDEFTVRLMRAGSHNFFGVSIDGGLVAGPISTESEEQLAAQWDSVKKFFDDPIDFDFRTKLEAVRLTEWYKKSRERRTTVETRHRVVRYGEEDALAVLLDFSRLCLEFAKANKSSKHFLISLSILLPVSQFCLNEIIWDAKIGQRAASQCAGDRWRDFSTIDKLITPAPSYRPGYIRPFKKRRAMKEQQKTNLASELCAWFEWENEDDPLSNLIAIPIPDLLQCWRQVSEVDAKSNDGDSGETAQELMHRVDQSIKNLRACHSVQGVEKTALQVASNLLNLAACDKCRNPFVCIQQAASFASHGPKGGTGDELFHHRLPTIENCTPHEALLILGRADCLQAIHFCQEAAFLCHFVLDVCRQKRQFADLQWNARWKIVACLAYDTSVIVRSSASALEQLECGQREDTSETWEEQAVLEMKQARADGESWKETIKVQADSDNSGYQYPPFQVNGFGSSQDDSTIPLKTIVFDNEADESFRSVKTLDQEVIQNSDLENFPTPTVQEYPKREDYDDDCLAAEIAEV